MTTAVWTTKDGRKIPVSKMSDQHLTNTIRLLERWAQGPGLLHAMLVCDHAISVLNGEMAIQSMEDELYRLSQPDGWEHILPVIYYDMIEEAVERSLDL